MQIVTARSRHKSRVTIGDCTSCIVYAQPTPRQHRNGQDQNSCYALLGNTGHVQGPDVSLPHVASSTLNLRIDLPRPIAQLRRIYPVRVRVAYAFGDLILQPLLGMGRVGLQLRDAIDDIDGKVKSIYLI